MNTKLTITLEKEVIEKTKEYAARAGNSLSKMVENYFRSILDEKDNSNLPSNRVKKLRGIIKHNDDLDYKEMIQEGIYKKHAK